MVTGSITYWNNGSEAGREEYERVLDRVCIIPFSYTSDRSLYVTNYKEILLVLAVLRVSDCAWIGYPKTPLQAKHGLSY